MIERTLSWLRRHENLDGGIMAWPGGDSYPEVTGYLIPTFYDYGENNLAYRCAEWLLTIQRADGAFPILGGSRYDTFDTAAVLQGLERIFKETGEKRFYEAAKKAHTWIESLLLSDGCHYAAWEGAGTRQYCLRVNGIMCKDPGSFSINTHARMHFIAYALEGYWNLGYKSEVRAFLEDIPARPDGLMPMLFAGEWNDVVATAQIAILKKQAGLDPMPQVEAVRAHILPNGGVPQSIEQPLEISWGAKFYLDMERMMRFA